MSSNYPNVVLVYDRYKRASSKRKASIEVRITYNYKQKYISTGVSIYPNQWKHGKVCSCPEAKQLNESINGLLEKIHNEILEMSKGGNIDIFSLPQRLEKAKQKNQTFIDYCNQRAVIRKYGKSKDSQQRYDRFIRLFMQWGGINNFADITESNIIAYDLYLEKQGMKPYSKWNNYHRFLNSFIMDAINEGFLSRNPYKWVDIDKGKDTNGIERCLTPEEFIKLKRASLPTKSLERVRDLFIFQTYTCLSYADLRDFNPDTIVEIKGIPVYLGDRKKTGKSFTIPLLTEAMLILKKYNNNLPVISNVKYNEYLKVVAQAAGIDKPVSSHWARHTGATMLLNEGIDIKIVSKICGHSSTRITEQIYAKLLDETVVDALADLNI